MKTYEDGFKDGIEAAAKVAEAEAAASDGNYGDCNVDRVEAAEDIVAAIRVIPVPALGDGETTEESGR